MLVAYRLAGLSALEGYYAARRAPAISPCGTGEADGGLPAGRAGMFPMASDHAVLGCVRLRLRRQQRRPSTSGPPLICEFRFVPATYSDQ